MSVDVTRYLEMERAFYADLVARSNFETEAFTRTDSSELVVGSSVHHESMDYERWLFVGGQHSSQARSRSSTGCGPGRMMLRLAPRFARIDGMHISQEVLDVANVAAPGSAVHAAAVPDRWTERPGGCDEPQLRRCVFGDLPAGHPASTAFVF